MRRRLFDPFTSLATLSRGERQRLLLALALSRARADPGCTLLLDEPTSAQDGARTSALLECVRQVYQGKRWMDPETLARGLSGALPRPQGTGAGEAALTAREREVVRLVGQGMRNKEIAERLSISEGTVKIHLHNVYDKLGVDGRLELLLTAQQKGLL